MSKTIPGGGHVIFLSTLSLRRATRSMNINPPSMVFSIHALLAESDNVIVHSAQPHKSFLSTLSLRRATRANHTERNEEIFFYPRSPCGERPQKCTEQRGTFAHMKQILWGLHLHADRQGCILPFLSLFFHIFWCEGTGNFMIAFPSH